MLRAKCKRKQFPHFIDRIGVELEGGFARTRTMGGTFHTDITVELSALEMDNVLTEVDRPTTCSRTWSCHCVYCD